MRRSWRQLRLRSLLRHGCGCSLGCSDYRRLCVCRDTQVRAVGTVWALLAGGAFATIALTWTLFTHFVGFAALTILVCHIALCGALTLGHVAQVCLWCFGEAELALLAFTAQCAAAIVLAGPTATAASTTASAATSITAFAGRVAAFAFTLGSVWALLASG